jgi:hypothetical protein
MQMQRQMKTAMSMQTLKGTAEWEIEICHGGYLLQRETNAMHRRRMVYES